jgi:hypothetical protein
LVTIEKEIVLEEIMIAVTKPIFEEEKIEVTMEQEFIGEESEDEIDEE